MYCITDQQIEYMLNDISARGVKLESLQQSLLDHICCIIEQNLEENGDFERFYHATIQTFYRKELAEIEAETNLLLTFKNYYEMRKTMLITGTVSAVAFTIGSFFKIMHWPGAALLLVAGFLLISFIFLPLLFVLKSRESAALRDKLILAAGVTVGILYCISMLFGVSHWPGAHNIWLFTLVLTSFLFIPAYFFTGIRKEETEMNTAIATILMIAAAGIQFTLTSMNTKPSALNAYFHNEQLLHQVQDRQTTEILQQNKLAGNIISTCRQLKTMIWQRATGEAVFPDALNNFDFSFSETDLGKGFTENGHGYQLFSQLQQEVDAYNAAAGYNRPAAQIPVKYSLLSNDLRNLHTSSNLQAMIDITQVQLSLFTLERQKLIGMN